ncbi:hypothetical protein MBANPS3_010439 [Mucor bainieri]
MACRLILQPSMTREDVPTAHTYFEEYNKTFVTEFTAELVKPYNQLLLHMAQNINDFSSVVHTWRFSYERFDYLIKSIETSKREHFERTIMKKFVEKSNAMSAIKTFNPVLQSDDALALLHEVANANGHMGNLPSTDTESTLDFPTIKPDHYDKKRQFYHLSSMHLPNVTGAEYVPGFIAAPSYNSPKDKQLTRRKQFRFLIDHYKRAYKGVYSVVKIGNTTQVRHPNTIVVTNTVVHT